MDSLRKQLGDLGADHVFSYSELADKSFKGKIADLTAGAPLKLGLNCVGGKDTSNMAKLLSKEATLVTYGAMSMQPLSFTIHLQGLEELGFLDDNLVCEEQSGDEKRDDGCFGRYDTQREVEGAGNGGTEAGRQRRGSWPHSQGGHQECQGKETDVHMVIVANLRSGTMRGHRPCKAVIAGRLPTDQDILVTSLHTAHEHIRIDQISFCLRNHVCSH